jgi:diacylglycerol kinase (ATP)
MKQIYFIINPNARNGHCLKTWREVEIQLKNVGLPYIAFFTEYAGHAKILSKQILNQNKDQKVVIAVGGDGTVHEVVNGLVNDKNVTLGFIPGGSGNDFSRGFHIPSDPIKAVLVILRLWKKDAALVDVGKITTKHHADHFFINNMGAGFDAEISFEANRSKMKALLNKLSMGRLIYVYFLLKKVFTYKTSTIHLSIDGKMHIFEKTWFVTVSNQPFYGGGMKIAPGAKPDDGLFDITIVHQLSRLKLLLVFISVFWGKHVHFREVKNFLGREISIQSDTDLYVHADGEHIGNTPLEIQVQDRALSVLTRCRRKREADLKERDTNDFF